MSAKSVAITAVIALAVVVLVAKVPQIREKIGL